MHLLDADETLQLPNPESLDQMLGRPPWSEYPLMAPAERFLDVVEKDGFSTKDANALVERLLSGGVPKVDAAYSTFVVATASLLVYLLQHESFERLPIQGAPQPQFTNETIYLWANGLSDWPKFLESVLAKYTAAAAKENGTPVGHPGGSQPILRAGRDVNEMATSLSLSQEANHIGKVLKNFLCAAFGLRVVYQGWNLPAHWPDLGEKLSPRDRQIQQEKLADYAEKITGRKGDNATNVASFLGLRNMGFEYPRATIRGLQIALAISPLLLLAGRSYTGRSVSTENIPLIWMRLGGCRPPTLSKMERLIWETLSGIALSDANIPNVVGTLVGNLTQELQNLPSLSPPDRAFFTDALSVVQKPVKNISEAPNSPSFPPPTPNDNYQPALRDGPADAQPPTPPPPPGLGPTVNLTGTGANALPMSPTHSGAIDRASRLGADRDSDGGGGNGGQDDDKDEDGGGSQDEDRGGGNEHEEGNSNTFQLAAAINRASQNEVYREPEGMAEESEDENRDRGRNKRGPTSLPRDQLPSHKRPHLTPPHRRITRSATTAPPLSSDHRARLKATPNQQAPPVITARSRSNRRQGRQAKNTQARERTVLRENILPRLVGDSHQPRISGQSRRFYNSKANLFEVTPSFHSKEDLEAFEALVTGVGDGQPQYLQGSGKLIKCMTYQKFLELQEAGSEGETLQTHAILVNDVPRPKRNDSFRSSLEGLGMMMDADICCHDQSVPLGPEGGERHRLSTLQQIADLSELPTCKSINCLDFPGTVSSDVPLIRGDTLDRLCYAASWDMHEPRVGPDTFSTEWSVVSTAWASHHIHMDTHGFSTTAVPLYGRKLWVLIRPVGHTTNSRPFSWMMDASRYNTMLTSDEFIVEYALLEPGNALIMPPGCPHMVFTLDQPAVFSGNHFYHGKSIQMHMFGLLHSAALPHSTNAEHTQCCISIVIRIAAVFLKAIRNPEAVPAKLKRHIRDVRSADGIKDLLVVCSVTRILPILFKKGTAADLQRAPGLTSDIVKEVNDSPHFRFLHAEEEKALSFSDDIYQPYLARICQVYCALLTEDASTAEGAIRKQLPECSKLLGKTLGMERATDSSGTMLDLDVEGIVPFRLQYKNSDEEELGDGELAT